MADPKPEGASAIDEIWPRITALLDQMLALPPEQRRAWLDNLEGVDPETAQSSRIVRRRDRAAAGRRISDRRFARLAVRHDARRPAHRRVHARALPRSRRHGRGLAGTSRRWTLRRTRRGEAVERRAHRTSDRAALRPRRYAARTAATSEHRSSGRRGHGRWRSAVSRPRIRRRRAHRSVLRAALARGGAAPRIVPERTRRGFTRASQPDRSSRSEAGQHSRDVGRPGEAARLRRRRAAGGGRAEQRAHSPGSCRD